MIFVRAGSESYYTRNGFSVYKRCDDGKRARVDDDSSRLSQSSSNAHINKSTLQTYHIICLCSARVPQTPHEHTHTYIPGLSHCAQRRPLLRRAKCIRYGRERDDA